MAKTKTANQTSPPIEPVARESVRPDRPVVQPAAEIIEGEHGIRLHIEMPGADENSADVSVDRNELIIRGTSRPPRPDGLQLVHAEFGPVHYERSFTITKELDAENIDASFRNGVLTLELPKAKQAHTQKINIKAG